MTDTNTTPKSGGILQKHQRLERNVSLLFVCSLLAVTVGGIVEIAPLFYLENTIEDVDGVRPYSPLELAGRDIYIREGCYVCHSQMIRPMRDEVERYGHYSLAAESKYDHPFQWGSKRTGPDLARVGGRYSDEWHLSHFNAPREVVPESIMPGYPFLARTALDYDDIDRIRDQYASEHIDTNYVKIFLDGVPTPARTSTRRACSERSRRPAPVGSSVSPPDTT